MLALFTPLRSRPLSYLWLGQVFSSIGDELYTVALVWFSADLIGKNTGYILAIQSISILCCSLFGGIWADRWDHRKTMILADILRGLVLLSLPIASAMGAVPLGLLICVTLFVSSMKAFFDPALRACIPRLAHSPGLLYKTNALMETTSRFAKVIGPGMVGILNRLVPMIHYFTIDAISFFISALTLLGLKKELPHEKVDHPRGFSAIKSGVVGGFTLTRSHRLLNFVIWTDAIVNAGWYLVMPLCIGILLHARMPENISALSLVVSGYGVGNLLANLILGQIRIKRFDHCLFLGRIVLGCGFLMLAFSETLPWMMVSAGIAAIAGPMVDLSKVTLIQSSFDARDTAKVYRFSMVTTYLGLLITLSFSPLLFSIFSIPTVIALTALTMAALGLIGFFARIPSVCR